ncbi:MAG TPA: hypothetical protein V6D22_04430 [Candidatus Obscuribacterales bacterium]
MTSSSIACPFCGEMMESPLKFCAACGRAVTQEDLRHAGLKLSQSRKAADVRSTTGSVSRRDFTVHRRMRSFMYTISAVLAVLIGYYFVMKHVLHEHMPGNLDDKIEQMIGNVNLGPITNSTDTSSSSSGASDQSSSHASAHH